jgi:hypothetical protein
MNDRRVAAVLAGMWAGGIATLGLIAAPAAFAVLQRSVAGAVAGRMFAHEAYAGLVVAAVLLWLVRRQSKREAAAGQGSVLSTNLVLVLGALFCTVFGYFALQPLMAQARTGQSTWSFGALHGASTVFFGLKGLLTLALAWRLARVDP